jgi:hypothetical protein
VKQALAVVTLAAALAATTAAASGPLRLIIVVPGTVHRGHTTTVGGVAGGCPVGDSVTLISRAFAHTHDFAGVPALYTRVHAGHKFKVATRIPATKRPGVYVVTARCGGGNLGVKASIHVIR